MGSRALNSNVSTSDNGIVRVVNDEASVIVIKGATEFVNDTSGVNGLGRGEGGYGISAITGSIFRRRACHLFGKFCRSIGWSRVHHRHWDRDGVP